MGQAFNIYCDESCHLENDKKPIMVLGAVWCPQRASKRISQDLHAIKEKHGLARKFEVKWKKVSASKVHLYQDFIQYFFDCSDLHFRAWIAEKDGLDHVRFPGQDHDTWYYKMYFGLLKIILSPHDEFFIYLDIKDHWGGKKKEILHDVMCNSIYDFSRSIVKNIQIMHSSESELMQLSDLLIGAVSYVNRDLSDNLGKKEIIAQIKQATGYSLKDRTLFREEKFNIFRWSPRGGNDV